MIFFIINATSPKTAIIPLPFREGPGVGFFFQGGAGGRLSPVIPLPFREGPGVGPFVKKYCLSTPS